MYKFPNLMKKLAYRTLVCLIYKMQALMKNSNTTSF
jgi:hypothetical protein